VQREILLQQPVAVDLRYLLSVLRVLPVLERSHDLLMAIALRANHVLGEDLTSRSSRLVERMSDLASAMWRRTADSWYQRDRTAQEAMIARDHEMDELHSALIAELASGQMALPVAMEMTLAARDYKRLGRHALNVARRIVYLAGHASD
jgi:phosphate transport system protein